MTTFSRALHTGAALLFFACVAGAQQPEPHQVSFAVDSQLLPDALNAWAQQSGLQIIWPVNKDAGRLVAPPLNGSFTPEHALKLLLAGSGLQYTFVDSHTVAISIATVVPGKRISLLRAGESTDAPRQEMLPRLAQSASDERFGDRPSSSQLAVQGNAQRTLEEVVTTGSLIRGTQSASPVIVIDRDYIKKTGYSTLHQVLQTLPQNFGGGDAEGAVNSPGGSAGNVGYGSSVNLRGLGAGSTLVLLDGQRLAPAGDGQFVDISLIPISAVERVEVVTDGASATYGSDAVGGTVNIILRDSYDGAETQLSSGSVAHGGMSEFQASQSLGKAWESANVLLNYEYRERGNLDANDREYSSSVDDPYDLLPKQKGQSLFFTANAKPVDRLGLRATVLASERDSVSRGFYGIPITDEGTSRQVNINVGAEVDLPGAWQAVLSGLHSTTKNRNTYTDPFETSINSRQSDLRSAELRADGAIFSLPGGAAKMAVGSSYRDEGFEYFRAAPKKTRSVSAQFSEFFLPFYGASNSRPGLRRLEVTLAARHENYSDFGATTNPKFGALWSPVDGFNMRGTFGKSFRAPIFSELIVTSTNVGSVLTELADPASSTGTTLTMLTFGKNADLDPERAKTWTIGMDFEPHEISGAKLSVTYFDTEYKDRIAEPLPGGELFTPFDRAEIFAPIIDRTPDPATVSALAAYRVFFNLYGPFAPGDVQAIVDARTRNLSVQEVRGLDFSAAYALPTDAGEWSFQLASTYLLDFTNRVTNLAPADSVSGAIFHPADFRTRANIGWAHNAWAVSAAVEHTDSLRNRTTSPATRVGSWTTADLQISYELHSRESWLSNTRIAMTVLNIFDRDPPHVTSPLADFNVGYDPTNASPLGRFFSLSLAKSW